MTSTRRSLFLSILIAVAVQNVSHVCFISNFQLCFFLPHRTQRWNCQYQKTVPGSPSQALSVLSQIQTAEQESSEKIGINSYGWIEEKKHKIQSSKRPLTFATDYIYWTRFVARSWWYFTKKTFLGKAKSKNTLARKQNWITKEVNINMRMKRKLKI